MAKKTLGKQLQKDPSLIKHGKLHDLWGSGEEGSAQSLTTDELRDRARGSRNMAAAGGVNHYRDKGQDSDADSHFTYGTKLHRAANALERSLKRYGQGHDMTHHGEGKPHGEK